MAKHFGGSPERSGRIYEQQVFTACEDTPAARALIEKFWTGSTMTVGEQRVPHLTFENAILVAKSSQPPLRPDRPERAADRVMRELRNAIVEELDARGVLEVQPGDTEIAAVRMYTGRIPVLDGVHGVDGFLEFADPKTRRTHRVTFDATIHRAKISGAQRVKADVMVSDLPDAVEERDAYYGAIEAIAREACDIIVQRRALRT